MAPAAGPPHNPPAAAPQRTGTTASLVTHRRSARGGPPHNPPAAAPRRTGTTASLATHRRSARGARRTIRLRLRRGGPGQPLRSSRTADQLAEGRRAGGAILV